MEDEAYREPPTEGTDEEYPLAPEVIEEDTEARWYALRRLAAAVARLEAAQQSGQERQHLSLRYMLGLMTAASVLFAIARLVTPSIFAFGCGMVALVSLLVMSRWPRRSIRVDAAWWTLLLVYLITIVVAALECR